MASVALHAALIALLLVPAVGVALLRADPRAAGIFGPRGGGGGGGGGRLIERLHYLQVAPQPPPRETPRSPVRPVIPPPKPVPVPPPREPPKAALPKAAAVTPPPDTLRVSSADGPGGRDAGPGAGPGTGGGTGTGAGTGQGAGRGPGTGGDAGAKNKATADLVTVYTVDPPKHPRPFHLVAVFEVSETGAARLLSVNKSDDGDFNRKIRDHLLETHFKPATRLDGTPVRDTVEIIGDY
jgi:periplasmic protein TonB